MTMDDLLWGLMMMVLGMGAVFALLLALMLVLMLIGRLGRGSTPAPAAEPVAAPPARADATAQAAQAVRIVADGLDEDQIAAITVAVISHVENRRRKAAPETRAHAPGSQLFASRWLAAGRGLQNQPFTRR